MSRWLKITLISAVIIFGLLLSTMVIVPWQVKKQGSNWISENTQRTLSIEKVFFNPFTLTLEISGAKLTEQNNEQPFVTFNRLLLSGSVNSIIRQAIILDHVEFDDPFVNVELLGKQEFNFSDFTRLGSDKPEPVTTEPAKTLFFSFNNIVINNGSIDFTDQTSEKKSQHKIRELILKIPFVGNVPYLANKYVEPFLHMLLNGTEVQAKGQLKPFHDSLETDLYLTLDDVDLAFYAYHSPVPLPIEVKQGTLDCEIDFSYHISKSEKPRLMLGGKLTLSDVDLRERDGRELFRMPSLSLDLDWANLFTQDFNLVSLDIDKPEVYIDRDTSGLWNFQRIMPNKEGVATTDNNTTTEDKIANALPLVTIAKLALIDGQVHYRDDFVADSFSEEIRSINLVLNNLSTHQGQKTGATLKLQTNRDFATEISGELGISPVTAKLNLNANQLPLEPYYPYLERLLTAPIAGMLDLSGQLIYTEDGNIQILQGQVDLNDLRVPFSDKDRFTLANFNISDSSFDLKQQDINLGSIELSGGDVKATRFADGSFSPLQLLRKQPPEDTKKVVAKDKENEENQPWNIHADNLDLKRFKLLFTDLSMIKKPQANIPEFNFHAENLSYPVAEKSPFSLAAQLGKKGNLKIDGEVVHTPLQLQAQTEITAFPLVFLNNFVPENLNIDFKDGRFFSTLTINLDQQPDKLNGSFSGNINIDNFDLRDPIGDGELLTWNNLRVDGIKGEIAPLSLHITDVVLNDYLANIQITPEGQVNLTSVTVADTETNVEMSEIEPASIESTATRGETTSSEARPDIRVDTLILQGGTVSFIDRHLPDTFSTTMYELGGRVTGLASNEQMQADVDLRGQLENNSPLTVSGKINPLSQDLFTDLTFSFKDIDLTPMTPYSGTYLGYVIDKGKLNLDLNYQIEHRKIKATNKVMLDQFTLGDTVASDKATSLPVPLAVALLKDNDGEIHLDIPVSGDMDDPNFSIGSAFFIVLKNLLVKAATAPFSLLEAMLGGEEDFTSVSFPPGTTTIDAEQLTKLESLAEMLAKRPALTLEISGFADKEQDPEDYRQQQLKNLLVDAKWRKLVEDGAAPATKEAVVVSDEEYEDTLLTVYKEAEFPRPRNVVGMLKKLPVEEMQKLLLTNIMAGDEQLEELAKDRAMSVREALVAINKDIKPRLFLTKPDIYQPAKDGPASRVEFNISTK